MKKVVNFLTGAATILVIVIALLLPVGWRFALYGSYHDGYTVYRYRNSTEVLHTAIPGSPLTTIVGDNDCTPSYKIVQTRNPKGGGSYEKCALSPQDYQDWEKALR